MPDGFTLGDNVSSVSARDRQTISWKEFEGIYNNYKHHIKHPRVKSDHDVMYEIGYSTVQNLYSWKKKDEVPVVAANSLRFKLSQLTPNVVVEEKIQEKTIKQFDYEELAALLGVLAARTIKEETRKDLIKKLAGLISAE